MKKTDSIVKVCSVVSEQLPPEKNCHPVRVWFWVKVSVSFRVGGTKAIAPKDDCPPVRIRVWLELVLRLGGSFPRGQLS